MSQNLITDPKFTALALIAEAVKTAIKYHNAEIEAACREALQGKTPNEPLPDTAIAQIFLRGFCLHQNTVWGLKHNIARGCLELVRLIEARQESDDSILLKHY